ncbi:MAG TPA: hypothetical protein PLD27_08395 [bacterium]|nr:hypothetical protein [bacterium]HOL48650.1 hypothetical protein [bacterium]HPQ19773.1 hypothetical protein [bacterium]
MLLKDTIKLLLQNEEKKDDDKKLHKIKNRIIGKNLNFNITYSNTFSTNQFLKKIKNQQQLFKLVGPFTRGKKFTKI